MSKNIKNKVSNQKLINVQSNKKTIVKKSSSKDIQTKIEKNNDLNTLYSLLDKKNIKALKTKNNFDLVKDIHKPLCDIYENVLNEKIRNTDIYYKNEDLELKKRKRISDDFNLAQIIRFKEFVSSYSNNNMIGVYFSGTGNTKYCMDYLLKQYDKNVPIYSIEDKKIVEKIKASNKIVFGYPIQFSNIPKIVRDFILNNKNLWRNKQIFIVATMGLFSGDGAGVAARLFKKNNAIIIGGLHLKMPDSVCDIKILNKSDEENKLIIENSKKKITKIINKLKNGGESNEGLGIGPQIMGLLGQRLWFFHKTSKYSSQLKINKNLCIGCSLCAKKCPMKNIDIVDKKAFSSNKCTMCYRCVNSCPQKAITLLGKKVFIQRKLIK